MCHTARSAGTGGSRGTVAREDREHFALNAKIAFMPDKLVVPRDDAYTGKPWTYPLDPYLPMVSTAVRPFGPAIPKPLIPFDFGRSTLTVTVRTPSGEIHALGPAPLVSGQNDLSVLRPDYVAPDYVAPDRLVPPVRPTYGNPSMSDMYHLTGRGAFDYAFREYGHYVIQLEGSVDDVTVRHEDKEGALWMACRRGASVVVTPESKVVVHGERGNRSPTARWRARWFLAGDGRFVAPPPPEKMPPELPPDAPPDEKLGRVDLGHTCFPYESGDVAWLGHTMAFSLFPGLTFEDPEGTIADLVERRWPAVREGAGRKGLYPYHLKPEDRRAIGEMPYASMTASGVPPSIRPDDVDQWGYFYVTSWRPGLSVRTLVAEDAQPVGYWFFDDPYAYQFGNGPQGDLPGDVKMNYGGGVFRDRPTGVTHYGGYASMLVLIDGRDPLGARVLPPFDGIVPGSPPCGPLLKIGGKRYDVFLTFGAVAPGAVLEVGDRLSLAGVVWPPVGGHVQGEVVSPSGKRARYTTRSGPMGVFVYAGPIADEPGVWMVSAEGVASGKASVGMISELVPEADWPRGGGVGLSGPSFPVPVVGGTFEYVYDPPELNRRFPNIDTRIELPQGGFEHAPAWFDTVTFTFWAGRNAALTAGMVLLQGEEVFVQAGTDDRQHDTLGRVPKDARSTGGRPGAIAASPQEAESLGPFLSPTATRRQGRADEPVACGTHSSLMTLSRDGRTLFAAHTWSGEVVRLDVDATSPRVVTTVDTGGEPRSVGLWPDGNRLGVAIADQGQILVLDAGSLEEVACFHVSGEPRAVLPSAEGSGLFVADFDRDRVPAGE